MNDTLTLLSFGPDGWGDEIARGTLLTIALALATLPFGLIAGFFLALAKRSSEPSLRLAADIYTTIFRGLPELLTLFLVYFGAPILLNAIIAGFGGEPVDVNSFLAGMFALGFVFSAYSSEVFFSAFKGLPDGQFEAGYAVGLTNGQTMRLVILPQLVRLALPGLSNLWLILLKETALVSAIGLSDILRQSSIAARVTSHAFLFFGTAFLIYLVLSIISSLGIRATERWARRGEEG
ncbi:MAG: ABC transporter permease [Alphaproteobacteria bacterium]